MLQAAPSAPKKAIVQKSPPSKSELLRVLRAAPSAQKKLSPKNPPSPKNPSAPSCSECSQKSYRPKKIPTQSPSSSPNLCTNSALQRLTTTSPIKSPHHFVIAPRPTTHYLCFQKSQISHVHKHNAFQFRLRNRNISSS